MKKQEMKKLVLNMHEGKIWKQERTRNDGSSKLVWVTKLKKAYVTSSTYDGLISKLYDHYIKECSSLLSNLANSYLVWKSEENISMKSLMEYKRLLTKYLLGDPIANNRLSDIYAQDWLQYFRKIVRKYKLTKKSFMQFRCVVSGIYEYAIESGIAEFNLIRDIPIKRLNFREEPVYNNIKAQPFTTEQAQKIALWCCNNISPDDPVSLYYLAILFDIQMGLRFAELCGLRWIDIDFTKKIVTVSCQSVLVYEMKDDLSFSSCGRQRVDHMKAHENPRVLPLPQNASAILSIIRSMRLNDEYVFPQGYFRYHTFNDKVKLAAQAIGMDPRRYRTHCLRSTVASNAYYSSYDIKMVQRIMGHTTPEMTSKYIIDLRDVEQLRDTMNGMLTDNFIINNLNELISRNDDSDDGATPVSTT